MKEKIGARPIRLSQAQGCGGLGGGRPRPLRFERAFGGRDVPQLVPGGGAAGLVEYSGHVPGTSQKVVLTALGGSTATPAEGITADVVVVNDFDELKSLGRERVSGKIVLFNEIYDKRKAAAGLPFAAYGEAVRYPGAGPKAAAELVAAA